jgi:hypothetical protein
VTVTEPAGGPEQTPSLTKTPTPKPTPTPTPAPPTATTPPTKPPPTGRPTDPPTDPPADPPSKPTDPTPPPTDPPGDAPVIPDPLPDALAALTPEEIKAIDEAWPVCLAALADGWTYADMQGCLADQLVVPVDDPDLTTFLAWAVDTGLVPALEQPTGTP